MTIRLTGEREAKLFRVVCHSEEITIKEVATKTSLELVVTTSPKEAALQAKIHDLSYRGIHDVEINKFNRVAKRPKILKLTQNERPGFDNDTPRIVLVEG